ncbi:uncharacterized protein M421DRAFT_76564 [Didymella exigua CBS 183.55]|uniref:IEC3 subunit of the Ino80 complex, chromatin re-modelling-domain-containing protein n=1 Tax=Didymella exigua CBS 183.55 TaxID=1150837 RepID=A0A6A5R4G0_9PLEO|nr:uncharacterized protein M421DRAFT_76564 [Didymella exigua CBS 183.55]KAF1922981.1 hypothetical protein M421DRAFT_76564 [Didymella exigua CBS 183.55]
MATEAPQPAAAPTPDAPPPAPAPSAEAAQKPPVKRSWRRKFRKMRIRFDDAMSQSNALIMDEWKAMGTARRLQAENDQLLDALLDFNDQPRVSARQRFDLSVAAAAAAAADQPTQPADQLADQPADQPCPLKTLAALEAAVPHTTLADLPALPDGIDLSENAPGYLSPQHEEEYLLALDQLLQDPAYEEATRHHRTLHLGPSQPPLSEKDLTIRNPDSVYSWLRKNQPQVFLQDKDAPHHDNVSEKTAPKAASKKSRPSNMAAGRAGTPASKEDHDGEDSVAPEARGKPKKGGADADDTAYRPKGGSSRPAKRKRDPADPDAKAARKKSRPSAAAAAAPPAAS